jgi:hypothetical protein
VDAVVMDPPYGGNVMYAELADFFYVWLKRTAGHVYPELFRRKLTDKESEAVANPAKFNNTPGARKLADRDYHQRMAAIFAECRRVLKPDGILTVMFTHKETAAWDALARGLIEAGFTITASWPVNTEAEGSLHIKDKAAAKSTIFLACRPRPPRAADQVMYWEEVEPLVAAAVRKRIAEFEQAGMVGVDLYLACFGPALDELARHWPLRRGSPRPTAPAGRRVAAGEALDPYSVTPADALDAARREVKRWRLERLASSKRRVELDPLTEWFVLAWDAFQAPEFPYDEALGLARVVGLDLDKSIIGHVAEKKGSNVVLWDSARRAAKNRLGSPDGSKSVLDALHHAANRARAGNTQSARELLSANKADQHPAFSTAFAALLSVLPAARASGKGKGGVDPASGAAADGEALSKLRQLAYANRVQAPQERGRGARKAA